MIGFAFDSDTDSDRNTASMDPLAAVFVLAMK